MLQAAPCGARLGWVSPVKIRGFPEDRGRATLNYVLVSVSLVLILLLFALAYCPIRVDIVPNPSPAQGNILLVCGGSEAAY
jgi:hypothetical protein